MQENLTKNPLHEGFCSDCEIPIRRKTGRCKPCSCKFRNDNFEWRFWNKVKKTPTCWLWIGGRFPKGYGMFTVKGIPRKAHRISWQIHNGSIPEGLLVLHHCDNPPCVNPKHLWVGTHQDNVDDSVSKGRRCKGENQWEAKLSSSDILKIRKWYKSKKFTQSEMAKHFKVHLHSIENAIHRRTWAHLK